MKKQIILTVVIALMGVFTFAQDRPGWIYNTPVPANNTYLYQIEFGVGRTEVEAENQAFAKMFSDAARLIGQPFESNEINKALQNGTAYSVISAQYNIPINKVCEYSEKVGSDYKVYILCEIAAAGNITVQWSDFRGCDRQGIDGMAVLKSALLPGLGQFHKGQNVKGACFLACEAISVGSVVVAQSMRHTYINKMNSTNNASMKKLYADKANAFTTIRNISFGTTAAVYVWNVLDAIISKSNHTYASSYGNHVQLTPVITDETAALSLSINF